MSFLTRSLLVFSALLIAGCGREPGEDIAAEVNGHRISYEELEKHYQNQIREMSAAPSDDQSRMLRLSLLREVIDRQILLQKAEELGLIAADAEVEESLKAYRAPYSTNEEFTAYLQERGMAEEDLRNEIRRALTIEKLLNEEITSKISISDEDLRSYYEQNKASFSHPEQRFHLAQIVVTARPEVPVPNLINDDAKDLAAAQQKIEMIEQRLRAGEDFAELAQTYSEHPVSTANGGDIGFVPPSALEEADVTLRRVVASLSPGEISPVIKLGDEFQIIKLISIEPAGQREFADPRVQQTIRETLTNRRDQLLKAAYLEVVRNDARVRNYFARRIVETVGAAD